MHVGFSLHICTTLKCSLKNTSEDTLPELRNTSNAQANLMPTMLPNTINYMKCHRLKEKIPNQSLQLALRFSSTAEEIISEESTIFTTKCFCPGSAVVWTPENTKLLVKSLTLH